MACGAWAAGSGNACVVVSQKAERNPLKRLALLRATGVRRQKTGDVRQGGKPCNRSVGFTEKRASVLAQEQDGRAFAGFIGRLPIPGTARVGSLEGGFHGSAETGALDPLPAFQQGEKLMGGGDDGGRTDKAIVFQLTSLTDIHWSMSGEVVLMTLVGGLGTVFGPIVGAIVIVAMQNYLSSLSAWATVVQGAVFAICVMPFREGVIGLVSKIIKKPL
jgi:hypothetical protein